jgi:hypothetical protein
MPVKSGKPIIIYDSLREGEVNAQFFGGIPDFLLTPPVIFGFEPWAKSSLLKSSLTGGSSPLSPSIPSASSAVQFVNRMKPPFIDVDLTPVTIKRADFHADRIELEIDTKVINKSKPGYKWKENPKTGEKRDIAPIPNTGSLFGVFNFPLKIIKNMSMNIQNGFKTIVPKMDLTVKKKVIKKVGIIGLLTDIWTYWRRKEIYVDTNAEVTVKYKWGGSLQTQKRIIPLKGNLPVEKGCVHFTRWYKKCF